jgi:hypothetical protein
MTPAHEQNSDAIKASYMTLPGVGAKSLGYSVMRSGKVGVAKSACIVFPHLGNIESATFDATSGRMEAVIDGGIQIALTNMPDDIRGMLNVRPQDVMLLSVDTLSRARASVRASELL